MASRREVLDVAGHEVVVTNPDKVYFPRTGRTKWEVVQHYLAVADGALRGVAGRPMALKRYVNGVEGKPFFQKRAPDSRPPWIETVELRYPSGRSAHEVVVNNAAQLIWVVNLGCIDLNPHPVRADDLERPDELRVDLDPMPGVPWSMIRDVAMVTKEVLEDHGLTGWPKTSGSRGFHVYSRLERRWTFDEVRRSAVALAREIERRAPDLCTTKWWKEERHGVFIDYNQNAKDRTVASVYSVRPTPDARVSTPLAWDEVPDCDPADYTVDTLPERYARLGDLHEGMDASAGSLVPLLELVERQADEGLGEAPWPPFYEKQPGEPPRVQPSKRVAEPAPGKTYGASGRRRTSMPLIEVARAANQDEAMVGLERWKERHPHVWPKLGPTDVLVDSMRGRSSNWTRIRLNLRNVPEDERPPQEALEIDYDPWAGGTSSASTDPT